MQYFAPSKFCEPDGGTAPLNAPAQCRPLRIVDHPLARHVGFGERAARTDVRTVVRHVLVGEPAERVAEFGHDDGRVQTGDGRVARGHPHQDERVGDQRPALDPRRDRALDQVLVLVEQPAVPLRARRHAERRVPRRRADGAVDRADVGAPPVDVRRERRVRLLRRQPADHRVHVGGPHAVVDVGHVEAVAHEDEVDAVGPAVALDERDRPGLGPVVGAHAIVRAGRAGGEEQDREGRRGKPRHHPDTPPTRASRTEPSAASTGR